MDPAAANRKLINTWRDSYHLPHDYAWRWFGWHCVRANEQDRLLRLLLDFGWLNAKLKATDVLSVVSDYDLVANELDLGLVQRALRLSVLALSRSWTHFPTQLIGRLREIDEPRLRALLEKASAGPGTAWPQTASLTAPGPLLQIYASHTHRIAALAVLPDGRALSGSWDGTYRAGSWDGTLRLWDLESGISRVLEGHTGEVTALAVLPDGRALSGSHDRILPLRLWDLDSGDSRVLEGHTDGVTALAVLPDGRALSGSADGTLRLWDLDSGNSRALEGHTYEVTALAVLPDGRALSGSWDHTLRLWDLPGAAPRGRRRQRGRENVLLHRQRRESFYRRMKAQAVSAGDPRRTMTRLDSSQSRVLEGHTDGVTGLAVLPDGRALSRSQDHTLRLWDLESGISRVLAGHTDRVTALAVLPDGRALSGSWDCSVIVWDLASGAPLATFVGDAPMIRVAATPTDLLAGSANGAVHRLRLRL